MDRPVKAGEVFATFNFDGTDCADMGVYSITSSGTYTMQIEPTFNDDMVDVPAYDGHYYYGTQYSVQQFSFDLFADDLSLAEYRNLKVWLTPRKIGKLILSDQPYKYYLVKVASISPLNNYPRLDPYVCKNSVLKEPDNGVVIYTGTFNVTFETIGSVYGYGLSYYRDDLIYDALNYYGLGEYPENYYYDSGLLYKDMSPSLNTTLPENAQDYPVKWYNPGSASALPVIKIKLTEELSDGSFLTVNNNDTNSSTIIDVSGLNGENIIDTESEMITDSNGHHYFGRFQGNSLEVGTSTNVEYIPESFVENIEDAYFNDYYSIYVVKRGDKLYADINPLIYKVKPDCVDKFFCYNGNGGAKILATDIDNNRLLLDQNPYTYPTATLDENEEIIQPAGFACNYTGGITTEEELPETAHLGDVKSRVIKEVNGITYYQMYLYRYDKWDKTSLFTDPEDFVDTTGNYTTQYLMFGANIVGLSDITISTNFGETEIEVSLLPRYL